MSEEVALRGAFAAALLDPELALPPGLRTCNGSDPAVRFAVYRNNVAVSLVEALADTFPVTRRLLGSAFFNALARGFIAVAPPRSAVLTDYGDGFADFVAAVVATPRLPQLRDLMSLERKRVQAFHAADAEVLAGGDLVVHLSEPERLPAARIRLHPSVAIVRSRYPVYSVWSGQWDDDPNEPAGLDRPESALVLREHDDVVVLPVREGAAAFVSALIRGALFGEAVTEAGAQDPGFDLVESLALLISRGCIAAWHPPGDSSP